MNRWLVVACLAAVAAFSYMRAPWAADKTDGIPWVGPAQRGSAGGPLGQRGNRDSGPGATRKSRPSPYWLLERRYWALERQAGRLGAEVRRLRRLAARRQLEARMGTVATIRLVFLGHEDEAVRVASCETGGTFSPWATNGQYKNIFQMGESERRQYGWHTAGSPVLVATLAAYRYFLASGSDWSPWSCKP